MKKYIALICFALICVSLSSCAVYTVDDYQYSHSYDVYYHPSTGYYYYHSHPKPVNRRYARPKHIHSHPAKPTYHPHSKPSPAVSRPQPHSKPNPKPAASRNDNKGNPPTAVRPSTRPTAPSGGRPTAPPSGTRINSSSSRR